LDLSLVCRKFVFNFIELSVCGLVDNQRYQSTFRSRPSREVRAGRSGNEALLGEDNG